MNEEITAATGTWTTIANFFEANPVAKWLALAWVFGWIIAFIARPFIRLSPLPDRIESHLVLLSCIAASAGAAWRMWSPQEHAVIVATVMGGTSPFGYLLLAWLACKWKPELKPHLSLQKDFTAAVDDDTGDDLPPKQ